MGKTLPDVHRRGAVFVACSTKCFSRLSLEDALDVIAELEFSKFEAALDEQGNQLRPSEVAADIGRVATRLRHGPGLTPAAFSLNLDDASNAEFDRQFKAVCRLARISAVPLITIKAAAMDTSLDDEIKRLHYLVTLAAAEGIQLSISTITGTLTEDPDTALALCQRVR